ncbi:reverse transcriptase domain-containing protein [Tanacetum coccineum]
MLVASEIQIVTLQSEEIGRDIREVGRMHTTRQTMSFKAIEELIAQRVADALLTYETNQNTRNGNVNGSHNGTEEAVKYATCTLLNGALTWWNSHVETIMPPKRNTTPMTDAAIKELIAQGIADALAEYEANRSSRNGDDSHDLGSGRRMTKHTTRECTYSDFLKCQTLNFKGTKGFATCTLLGNALTWWNSHVKSVGHDAAYGMTWKTLKKMMTDKYCPMSEIKKLEIEIWNLKVKGMDVVSYTQRFQELALMCGRMYPEESDEVEKYVSGLPDMIQGSVMASKPKTMQEAIEFANELMDQKIHTFAERQAKNKRKLDNN